MTFSLLKNQLYPVLLALLFFMASACATEIPVVAVASNMKFAMQEIAERFQQDTGKKLRISYSSSGNLMRQIQQGGPFELFLSANTQYASQLYQQHKTLDQGKVYALGRLVLLTNKSSALALDEHLLGLKQALKTGQLERVAIANPAHAPFGIAAREVLEQQGLWDSVQRHLILGENVAQATQFASSGAAQVALVAYSLALAPSLQKRVRYVLLPETLHQPLQQTAVLLPHASATATLFFYYLQQDTARGILSRHGYSIPE